MKRIVSLILDVLIVGSIFAQTEITDKGYFYSPNGFTCKDGSIYTADMRTLVRFGYNDHRAGYYIYEIYVPEGAYTIPSNMLYHPTPHHEIRSTEDIEYKVYIPSTVKWIATDAFVFPFVSFYSYDDEASPIQEIDEKQNVNEKERYNLQGYKLQNPEQGINIVRYSNNNTRKELVK